MKKCNDKMTFIMDNTLYADITIPLDDGNESNNVIVALAVMVKI